MLFKAFLSAGRKPEEITPIVSRVRRKNCFLFLLLKSVFHPCIKIFIVRLICKIRLPVKRGSRVLW